MSGKQLSKKSAPQTPRPSYSAGKRCYELLPSVLDWVTAPSEGDQVSQLEGEPAGHACRPRTCHRDYGDILVPLFDHYLLNLKTFWATSMKNVPSPALRIEHWGDMSENARDQPSWKFFNAQTHPFIGNLFVIRCCSWSDTASLTLHFYTRTYRLK